MIRVKKFFYRAKSLSDFSCWVFFSSSVLLWYAYLLTVTDLRLCFFLLCPSIHQSSSSSCETEPGRGKKKTQFPLRQQKGQQEGHRTDEKTANSFTDFLIWGSWYKNIPGSDVQTEACLYIYKIKWSANHTRRFMLTVFLKHTKMSRMYHQLLLATILLHRNIFNS